MATWVRVGTTADVERRKKVVVEHGDHVIVVFAHAGRIHALDNICVHRQRELVKGVILGDRIVCPGHQWAFDLVDGWEAKMQRCQPIFTVKIDDGDVFVDTESRRLAREEPTPAADPSTSTV